MTIRGRFVGLRGRGVIFSVAVFAAVVVFAVVQDRVTAAAARRYVAEQRAALATGSAPLLIDDVMRPAIVESVREASIWSGGVLVAGGLTAMLLGRR
jgi:hypothetical protein